MPNTTSTLVIGLGNEFRGDDFAGLAVVRLLKKKDLAGVSLYETARDGTDLIEQWKQFDHVIVIDAVRSNLPPGHILRIDLAKDGLPAQWHTRFSHLFSLAEAIRLSKELKTLPSALILFGIEAATFETGVEMSAPVRHAIERVVTLIEKEISEYSSRAIPQMAARRTS